MSTLNVSSDDLLQIIGRKQVEIEVLTERLIIVSRALSEAQAAAPVAGESISDKEPK